jgi:hypothetical protein
MKNPILRQSILFFCLLTSSFLLQAQAPQGIPYQAIARNASGVAIANTAVKVRFSIRDSLATGAIKYQETHNPTTSALGLFSVNVGMGTVVSGTFSGINWGKNAKFLQVELNTTGGTSYTDLGTTQMMSVPYALCSGASLSTNNNFSNRVFFSQSGNWKVPTGITKVKIQLWAGSGGGGAGYASLAPVTRKVGQTGGDGGYIEKQITVKPDSIIQIVIGSGGLGGIPRSSNGGSGGNSIFGNVIANGGTGGVTASFQSETLPPLATSGLIDLNILDQGLGELISYLALPDYLRNGQLKVFPTPGGAGQSPGQNYQEGPGGNGANGYLIINY